jgi:hypothetical protein
MPVVAGIVIVSIVGLVAWMCYLDYKRDMAEIEREYKE